MLFVNYKRMMNRPKSLFRSIRSLLLAPLVWVYLKTPRVWGIGGYGGLYAEDACSRLTNSPAAFWQRYPEQCRELLESKVEGMAIVLVAAMLVSATMRYCYGRNDQKKICGGKILSNEEVWYPRRGLGGSGPHDPGGGVD